MPNHMQIKAFADCFDTQWKNELLLLASLTSTSSTHAGVQEEYDKTIQS
jgi:hypothetical protein